MKLTIVRRVALRRQYEFTELRAEDVRPKDAESVIENLEDLADYSRDAEFQAELRRKK